MKRILSVFLLLFGLFFALTPLSRADVIVDEFAFFGGNGQTLYDQFFRNNEEKCTPHRKIHIVNSPEGGLPVYTSPKARRPVTMVRNRTELAILYTYQNGKWGMYQYIERIDGKPYYACGWIQMEHTVPKFVAQTFMEQYSVQFYLDDDVVREKLEAFAKLDRLAAYTYPGSGSGYWGMTAKELIDGVYSVQALFEDKNGKIWAYLDPGNNKHAAPAWVCLDDPENLTIPEIIYLEYTQYPSKVIEIDAPNYDVFATILACVLAAGSGVWILFLRRKKKNQEV